MTILAYIVEEEIYFRLFSDDDTGPLIFWPISFAFLLIVVEVSSVLLDDNDCLYFSFIMM